MGVRTYIEQLKTKRQTRSKQKTGEVNLNRLRRSPLDSVTQTENKGRRQSITGEKKYQWNRGVRKVSSKKNCQN